MTYAIELAPPVNPPGSWKARVTVHGKPVERDGFALPYTAFHWALDRYAELSAS